MDLITLEVLSDSNMEGVRRIQRDDICEAFVDTADTIIKLNQYGIDHHCKGHTYAVKRADECIGVILLGSPRMGYGSGRNEGRFLLSPHGLCY